MPSEIVIVTANILQSCVPFLSISAYIPQWKKLLTTKSSKNISIQAWLMWVLTSSIAVFYAIIQYLINEKGVALIFASLANLAFVVITVYMVIIYRNNETPKDN